MNINGYEIKRGNEMRLFKHWSIGWFWVGRAIDSGLYLWTLDENDTEGIEATRNYFFMTMNHLHTCKFPDLKNKK